MSRIFFKWKKQSLRKQILSMYFLGFFVTIIIFLLLYFSILEESANNYSRSRLDATIVDVEHRLDYAIERVAEDSKIIGFSNEVQSYLNGDTSGSSEEMKKTKIESSTIGIMVGNQLLDSIYIYDFHNSYYAATDNSWKENAGKSITSAPWYQVVMHKKGNYIVRLNSEGFFYETDESYLSVIRLVNNPNTLEAIGIVIANIPLSNIMNLDIFQRYNSSENIKWSLVEKSGGLLCNSNTDTVNLADYIDESNTNMQRLKIDGKQYDGAYTNYEKAGLMIYAAVQRNFFGKDYRAYFLIILSLCILILGLILGLTQLLTRSVRRPLNSVLDAMGHIKEKKFETIKVSETNREMTILQNGYNDMIGEIHSLFEEIRKEQKLKRKHELNVLNAQIRPHFLYNTFDSVCALALMERSKDVYLLMQALGKYYRISLHKGEEIITLGEELEIIKNYSVIQRYRFEDVFKIKFDVGQELMDYKILKLVLQPFVENAIYHGLKTKGFGGYILISGKEENGSLVLTIQDDGVGMSQEKIRKIISGEVDGEERSFGVYGTMQRISLHYGRQNLVSIISKENCGTSIVIHIPIKGTEDGGKVKNVETADCR